MLFLVFLPLIIIVMPVLAVLGIPLNTVMYIAAVLLALFTVFFSWVLEGAKKSRLWCVIPAALAVGCFILGRTLDPDLNLMNIIRGLIN